MNREKALFVLGLSECKCALTKDIVEEAFRKQVKLNHPDLISTTEKGRIIWLIDTIKDARDFLLKNLSGNADFTCKLCSGLGMVRAKIGWLKCSACKGTGEKR